MENKRERERERERQRETERDRDRDRQTDRQTEKQTDRETDRQTDNRQTTDRQRALLAVFDVRPTTIWQEITYLPLENCEAMKTAQNSHPCSVLNTDPFSPIRFQE